MLISGLEKLSLMGASWVLYLLVALSMVSIGIMFERWWYFETHSGNVSGLGEALLDRLKRGDQRGAGQLLASSKSIEAEILLPVVPWIDGGADSVSEALEGSLVKKRGELERGLTFLGTLGNNAPFIGLLGTVIGVIQAFHTLGAAGGGQNQSAMGNVMVQISEALVATGVGLLVALPAVVGFNLAQKRVSQIENNVTMIAKNVLALLKADAKLVREFRALDEDPPAQLSEDDAIEAPGEQPELS